MAKDQAIAALVVAAGSGSRAGGGLPKQFRTIGGRSVLAHAIHHLRRAGVGEVRVVIGAGQEALYQEAVSGLGLPPHAIGGAERQRSVRSGLEALAAAAAPWRVLIHDAARPFVPATVVRRLVEALESHDGAVPALPVADTLARSGEGLGEAVRRDELVRVQTPQAFCFDRILAAHRSWSGAPATDDAQIARAFGLHVAVVQGDPALDKLTFEEDFARAEAMLAARAATRVGLGFDVHAFGPGTAVQLGGIPLPHDRGLAGHSDADVVLHAVTDALLGAIGAGDIGDHFPPSDPQWRGAASSVFVEHAVGLVASCGGRIGNVDVTIVCEAPRIGPHREAMRSRIAGLLRLPFEAVSIKATTTERLGFTGRGEGIAVQAIATVRIWEDP